MVPTLLNLGRFTAENGCENGLRPTENQRTRELEN